MKIFILSVVLFSSYVYAQVRSMSIGISYYSTTYEGQMMDMAYLSGTINLNSEVQEIIDVTADKIRNELLRVGCQNVKVLETRNLAGIMMGEFQSSNCTSSKFQYEPTVEAKFKCSREETLVALVEEGEKYWIVNPEICLSN